MAQTHHQDLVDAVEGKVFYLLILIALIQSIYPITGNNEVTSLVIYQVFYTSMLVAGIVVSRNSLIRVAILIVLGIVWLVSGVVYAFNLEAIWAQILAYVAIAPFQMMITAVLLTFIFEAKRVTRDVLYAASAVYLLLGAIFVPIYGLIETVTVAQTGMHAFADGTLNVAADEVFLWQNFTYYSYATLTTLGYGDILPVTMWARSAASMEAIVGVLYITVIMARLVGLYASQEVEEEILKH